MAVNTDGNTIQISGSFGGDDIYYVMSAIHRITEKQAYKDIALDFFDCEKAYSNVMLPLCAVCLGLWKNGIDIHLNLPTEQRLKRLFLNTNWAHFIDPRQWSESRYRGFTHSPAIRFVSGTEQNTAVNRAMDVVLAAIRHLSRDELRYIEWVITELTDNVINHAESICGGLLQISNHSRRKEVEFVISDIGLGIPTTLKPSLNSNYTDAEVLHEAIRENVTRDITVGQGNGLYGSWRISQISNGSFEIYSGYGKLSSPNQGQITSSNSRIPFAGTTVQARIGYNRDIDLSEVMIFPQKSFEPIDYLETHYSEDEDGNITFTLRDESDGFGSRVAAKPVFRKLENLANQISEGTITVVMTDIPLVSSSYADEVFGKLFLTLGPTRFMSKILLFDCDPLVQGLIDRAIYQRTKQGLNNEN